MTYIVMQGRNRFPVESVEVAPKNCDVFFPDGTWLARVDWTGRIWYTPDAGARRVEREFNGDRLPLGIRL